jgi:hypothetical protein
MAHWIVQTPEYEYQEWIDGWILADQYPTRDFVYVEANTRREAITKGVAIMRGKEFYGRYKTYYNWHWDRSSNPFTGVTAQRSLCDHGYCYCDEPTLTHDEEVSTIEDCEICMAPDE